MAELHDLKPARGSRKKGRRAGRGPGSGLGKTAGHGQDGQKSRSGQKPNPGFEGGQLPLRRRIPKRGFHPVNREAYQTVNLRRLDAVAGDEVTPETLREHGLIRSAEGPVKILGDGEVERALTVRAHAFSASARKKIEEAGGTASLVHQE